jgi:spoIIIJ-associated protein
MEWVETTAKSVEEAKELALDQLGVDEADAEFEILEEPKPGLFGRVRGEARVRARVKPTRPRPKVERRDRRRRDREAKPDTPARTKAEPAVSDSPTPAPRPVTPQSAPSVTDVAAEADKFLQGLLDALGLQGTVTVNTEGDDVEVNLDGDNLGVLIGPRGITLLAVQDLVRVASQRRINDHTTRLRLDVSGYREKRREALARFALAQADAVVASGEPLRLEAMPSADRKVIHDVLTGRTDVVTHSEGEDPYRCVVIAPAS